MLEKWVYNTNKFNNCLSNYAGFAFLTKITCTNQKATNALTEYFLNAFYDKSCVCKMVNFLTYHHGMAEIK